MFPHLIYFIKTLYKLCASLAIFKDHAAIIYISLLLNTKTFIPINFDGSYARLVKYINKSYELQKMRHYLNIYPTTICRYL
jgi:hypothetical protein